MFPHEGLLLPSDGATLHCQGVLQSSGLEVSTEGNQHVLALPTLSHECKGGRLFMPRNRRRGTGAISVRGGALVSEPLALYRVLCWVRIGTGSSILTLSHEKNKKTHPGDVVHSQAACQALEKWLVGHPESHKDWVII